MAVDKIWVFAEAADGKVATITLEMLAKARELGGTVEAFIGGDGDAVAAELGAHGATTVHATGDLGDSLAGVPVAAAVAGAIEAGNGPDVVLFGTTYDGRDVAGRLSVRLDAPVITNVVDLVERDGALVGVEPVDCQTGYPSLHSDRYDFTDAALAVGMRMFVELLRNWR